MRSANALIRISYETHIACKTTALPVDPLQLARRLHLRTKAAEEGCVYREAMGSDRAMLVYESGEYVIYLKPESGEIRLPVVHEISHYLLKHIYDGPKEEEEAQLLSMFHLVPPVLLQMYRGDRLCYIREVSGVGEEAARTYLTKVTQLGRSGCRTALDGEMRAQFETYLREKGWRFRAGGAPLGKAMYTLFRQLPHVFGMGGKVERAGSQGEYGGGGAEGENPCQRQRTPVYVTPTGTKYHGNPQCAGANAVAVELEQALALKKAACSRCVFEATSEPGE